MKRGETNEETISPKNAFSFAISGSVFVNSVCAFAKCLKVSGEDETMVEAVVWSFVGEEVFCLTVLRREPIDVSWSEQMKIPTEWYVDSRMERNGCWINERY